ncbi:serine dehydratase-like isoform X2 [Haemaphysalis longicornis]
METGGSWTAGEVSPAHPWDRRLYCRTPLVESLVLQRRHLPDVPVYLKLENTQHTGSFKLRGLSRLCQHAARTGHDTVVTSSGGNAGLAVAFSARRLGITARVYVTQRTSQSVIDTLKREGAQVIVAGSVWDDADKAARDFVANEGGFYCHPFDDPIVWSGHASMMEEVAADLLEQGFEEGPSAVVTCVGGGGLLCGVLEGMHRVGWRRVPVIAMETHGAASFRAAWDCGRPVTIDGITRRPPYACGALLRCHAVRYLQWPGVEAVSGRAPPGVAPTSSGGHCVRRKCGYATAASRLETPCRPWRRSRVGGGAQIDMKQYKKTSSPSPNLACCAAVEKD